MQTILRVALMAAVASAPEVLSAQTAGSIEFAALGTWHNKTAPMNGLRGFGVGGRLGVWLPYHFELEGQLDFTKPLSTTTGTRYNLFHAGAGLLYNVPIGAASAYGRIGYGRLMARRCVLQGETCPSLSAPNWALGFRAPISGWFSVRGEGMVRSRSAYDYTALAAYLGVTIIPRRNTGSSRVDSDGDRVMDHRDRCRQTPRGAIVDDRGCPSDLDGDRVLDGIDRCPGTPRGTAVDQIGCPVKRPE